MKKLLLSLLIVFSCNAIYSQTSPASDPNAPEMTFEKLKWEFPAQPYASEFKKEFVFKNTGKSPLVIIQATTSCGCDNCSYPKEPIAPGKTGIITYWYDTKRPGKFTKSFYVVSNAKTSQIVVTVSGEIIPPPKEVEEAK